MSIIFPLLANKTIAENRIYPLILPQDATYPAITYQQISASRTHTMGEENGPKRVRVQVNCWGYTYAEAKALAGEVEQHLGRHRGAVSGVEVRDILLVNEIEAYESESQARRIIHEYVIYLS